jgi:hypothetical protein
VYRCGGVVVGLAWGSGVVDADGRWRWWSGYSLMDGVTFGWFGVAGSATGVKRVWGSWAGVDGGRRAGDARRCLERDRFDRGRDLRWDGHQTPDSRRSPVVRESLACGKAARRRNVKAWSGKRLTKLPSPEQLLLRRHAMPHRAWRSTVTTTCTARQTHENNYRPYYLALFFV